MRWREVDLAAALWTVPPERFKSDQWHLVPLSTQAVAVLHELQSLLPRVDRDAFVFSTTGGMKAIAGFGKVKARLDALMVADLGRPLGESFVNHDIRRTVRTRLSEIGINTEVAELVIGHTKGGLIGTYDMHQFLDERRAALQAWADRLDRIAAPQANVVELAAARSAS
jgi:integrase